GVAQAGSGEHTGERLHYAIVPTRRAAESGRVDAALLARSEIDKAGADLPIEQIESDAVILAFALGGRGEVAVREDGPDKGRQADIRRTIGDERQPVADMINHAGGV